LLKEKRGQRDWPVFAGLSDGTTSTSYLGGSSAGDSLLGSLNLGNDSKLFIQPSYFHSDPDEWGIPRTSMDRIQAEGEWDVEGAAACRDVQMLGATFTVPKSRLRVVNADVSSSGAGGGVTPEQPSDGENSPPLVKTQSLSSTSSSSDRSVAAAAAANEAPDRSRTNSVAAFAAALSRKDSQRSVSDGAVVRQESLRRRQAATSAGMPPTPAMPAALKTSSSTATAGGGAGGGAAGSSVPIVAVPEKSKFRPAPTVEQYDGTDWGDDDDTGVIGMDLRAGGGGGGGGGGGKFGDRGSVDSGLGRVVSSSTIPSASSAAMEKMGMGLMNTMMNMGMHTMSTSTTGTRRNESFDDAGVVGKVGFLFGKKMV
jgi:hypothetical protein